MKSVGEANLLAITYWATGRNSMFNELAKDLIAHPAKVSSPAEKVIKAELRDMLKETDN